MKTQLFALIAILCIFSLICAGQQREVTGKDLLAKMNSQEKSDKDYVMGYVQAVCSCTWFSYAH